MSAAAAAPIKPFRRSHRRQQSSVDILTVCGVDAAQPLSPQPRKPTLSMDVPSCPPTPPSEPNATVLIRSNEPFTPFESIYKPEKSVGAYAAALEARHRSPSPPRRMLNYPSSPVMSVGMARRLTF